MPVRKRKKAPARKFSVHVSDKAIKYIDEAWPRYKKTKEFVDLSGVALCALQLRHCEDLRRLLEVEDLHWRKRESVEKQLYEAYVTLGDVVRRFSKKPARYKGAPR